MSVPKTMADVVAYKAELYAKMNPQSKVTGEDIPDTGPESKLAGKITRWARDHGYPCQAFRQSHHAKAFLVPGWPDVTILLPEGRVVFLELKAAKGYMRTEQKVMQRVCLHLGHEYYKVKSYKRF